MKKSFPKADAIKIAPVSGDSQLDEILQLQQSNLALSLDEKEIQEQGFVTVQHDFATLKDMHAEAPSIVALDEQRVVGYALVMPASFRNKIPVLVPMFNMIDALEYLHYPLPSFTYFVMGQVCIAKDYRGHGIFGLLYDGLKREYASCYRLLITEVASRNKRSINAHLRVGLKVIHRYTDPFGETWELMLLDWHATGKSA
ncbi:MAG: GNAT family N-acetyltransferase [Chitinophagales bacterium]|nr:GNAT family N-acetyltransferase [Chitinophagales bacterium]